MFRCRIGEACLQRRATAPCHVLKMRDVQAELLFDQELPHAFRRISDEYVGKGPDDRIGIFGPLDRKRWGRQSTVLHGEPEIIAQRQAGKKGIAIHAVSRHMQSGPDLEGRGGVATQRDRVHAHDHILPHRCQRIRVVEFVGADAAAFQAVLGWDALFRQHLDQRGDLVGGIHAFIGRGQHGLRGNPHNVLLRHVHVRT